MLSSWNRRRNLIGARCGLAFNLLGAACQLAAVLAAVG
jgi:hypothetical protein